MKHIDQLMLAVIKDTQAKAKDPNCPRYQKFKREMEILFKGVKGSRGNR